MYLWIIVLTFSLSTVLFTSDLAQTNRTPIDFAEDESGFNVEWNYLKIAVVKSALNLRFHQHYSQVVT